MLNLSGFQQDYVCHNTRKFQLYSEKTKVVKFVFGRQTVTETDFIVAIFGMVLLKKGPIKITETFRKWLSIDDKHILFWQYAFIITLDIDLI